MTEAMSKSTLLGHCRVDVVEALTAKFHKTASQADASGLEVLIAAVTFTLDAAEFISPPQQRMAILDALMGVSLQ